MARSVVAPDGRNWKVGREWLPFRLRRRRRDSSIDPVDRLEAANVVAELSGWLAELSVGAALVGLALLVAAFLVFTVLWPALVLAAEVLVAVAALVAGLTARVVLRRPWRVVARSKDPTWSVLSWDVAGWRASGDAIDEVARALESGSRTPRPAGTIEVAT